MSDIVGNVHSMSETFTPMWTLGDRIRKAREGMGMKQADLAARLHVARSTIAGWENGVHRPSFSDLESIARACDDLPVEWLEFGTIAGTDTDPRSRWHSQQLELCLT